MNTKTENFEHEDLIPDCIEIIKSEHKASVSLFQRRLRLGYTRAAAIMDELEKRGFVGPAKGMEPRDILIDLDAGNENRSETTEHSTSSDLVPNALANFRAAHPEVRAVQDEQANQFRDQFRKLVHGGIPLPQLFHTLINKAEQSRLIGKVLLDFADTLKGKKLTRDFYEQTLEMSLFTDPSTNQPISFELLEWFMKVARTFPDEITSFKHVGACQQLLLKASGDDQFALESESQRPPPTIHPPPNPLSELKDFFQGARMIETVERLRGVPGYWEEGRLRPDLREQLAVEMRPEISAFDEAREFVRQQVGI